MDQGLIKIEEQQLLVTFFLELEVNDLVGRQLLILSSHHFFDLINLQEHVLCHLSVLRHLEGTIYQLLFVFEVA